MMYDGIKTYLVLENEISKVRDPVIMGAYLFFKMVDWPNQCKPKVTHEHIRQAIIHFDVLKREVDSWVRELKELGLVEHD